MRQADLIKYVWSEIRSRNILGLQTTEQKDYGNETKFYVIWKDEADNRIGFCVDLQYGIRERLTEWSSADKPISSEAQIPKQIAQLRADLQRKLEGADIHP